MKSLITLFLVFLSFACATESQETNQLVEVVKFEESKAIEAPEMVNEPQPIDDPYRIKMGIEKANNNLYRLTIAMELDHSISFISPNSKGNYKGVFSVSIKDNDKLGLNGPLLESPLSVEEYDTQPAISGYVNWVKVNTTYEQDLEIKSGDDFEVSGMVRFVIEPRNTYERIGFTITRHNEEMTIKTYKVKDGC